MTEEERAFAELVEQTPLMFKADEEEFEGSFCILVTCQDCKHFKTDAVTWCSKFRHRTNDEGYCAWPNDAEVR